MNDQQILAIALSSAPTMFTVLIGILLNNGRFNDLNGRFGDINSRITELQNRITGLERRMDQRFDEMKELWRSELHRVEEILDARLKHIEPR